MVFRRCVSGLACGRELLPDGGLPSRRIAGFAFFGIFTCQDTHSTAGGRLACPDGIHLMSDEKQADDVKGAPGDQPKRILLVDDDYEIVESIRHALGAKGFDVIVARDGNQGLAMAEREDPDLVILDMMMPKRSGFLVLEKLRRTHPVPVRVIMITANEGSRHKAYAEMLGVDDYIRKPFAMDRLVDSVSRLLS
jgi:CheY-like chemotaxis protein